MILLHFLSYIPKRIFVGDAREVLKLANPVMGNQLSGRENTPTYTSKTLVFYPKRTAWPRATRN